MFSSNKIIVAPSFCVGICITLLLLPLPWVAAWLVSGVIHELGHYAALRIQHIPVDKITLSFRGAYMDVGCMRPHAEIITALAGPLAGLCCLFISSYFPFVAVCGFIQSVYNLLPFPDYDGGRALSVLLGYIFTIEQAEKIYRGAVIMLSVFLLALGVCLCFCANLGPFILLFFLFPILKSGFLKTPCKGAKEIVQ